MLVIRLLGRPRLERDGTAIVSPRGTKTWALLARLVRSRDPISRQRLVDELFSEADDPMGALRWALAELRRSTGLADAFAGNPISGTLGSGVLVDIEQIARGSLTEVPDDGAFLEGIDVRDSATFETWLLIERQRVDTEVLGGLRQAVLRALARRDYGRAVELSHAMVRRQPLDEGHHILLIKSLASSGDAAGAAAQVTASESMLSRELGVPASGAVRAAARASVAAPVPGVDPRTSAESLRAAGLAALSAGAADAGIECLRGAAAAAEQAGDEVLLAACLCELGSAFVHSIRGYDDEGMVMLESAVEAARRADCPTVATQALSELGYVDTLFGRRLSAQRRLEDAREAARGDPSLMGAVASFEGMNLNDWGRLDDAEAAFREAISFSRAVGKPRREAWSLGVGSRTLFLQGNLDEARQWATQSVQIAHEERWPAFRPWAEAWGAHVDLALGLEPSKVRAALESTFVLSCQLQDACWEGVSAKAIALTHAAEGNYETAAQWLRTAEGSCRRVTDSYQWVGTDIRLADAEVALATGDTDRARSLATSVEEEAARFSMDGLLTRATAILATAS